MRIILTIIAAAILAGCGSSSSLTNQPNPAQQTPDQSSPAAEQPGAGKVSLALVAHEIDGRYFLELMSHEAQDLYQLAGSIVFDQQQYEIVAVMAGGGLGNEQATYFANSQREPGRVDFGYTKRYRGPGSNGEVSLVRLEVKPTAGFLADEFELLLGEGDLIVRDSRKHDLEVSVVTGGLR